MVFFALCAQCAATLAVIRRETNSWRWPAFTFAYMTALAYVGRAGDVPVGDVDRRLPTPTTSCAAQTANFSRNILAL